MWPTVIAGIVILLFVFLAVRSVLKSRKKGGCCGCSGCISNCAHNACGDDQVNCSVGKLHEVETDKTALSDDSGKAGKRAAGSSVCM